MTTARMMAAMTLVMVSWMTLGSVAEAANAKQLNHTIEEGAEQTTLSWAWKSKGATATITPVSPPITKIASAPMLHSIGTERFTVPSIRVAMKTKIWIPVGIATASDAAEKKPRLIDGSPVVNMWWAQSPKLMKRVPMAESTIHE